MPLKSEVRPSELEQLLLEATLLLVERTRRQLEREASQHMGDALEPADADDLPRSRLLEANLKALQERLRGQAAPVPAAVGRLPSRYYEVPGQEDA
jgi:hypothetical protein